VTPSEGVSCQRKALRLDDHQIRNLGLLEQIDQVWLRTDNYRTLLVLRPLPTTRGPHAGARVPDIEEPERRVTCPGRAGGEHGVLPRRLPVEVDPTDQVDLLVVMGHEGDRAVQQTWARWAVAGRTSVATA